MNFRGKEGNQSIQPSQAKYSTINQAKYSTINQAKYSIITGQIFNHHRPNIQPSQAKCSTITGQIFNHHRPNIQSSQAKYSTITGQIFNHHRPGTDQSDFLLKQTKGHFSLTFSRKHDKDFNKSSKSGSFSTVLYFYN